MSIDPSDRLRRYLLTCGALAAGSATPAGADLVFATGLPTTLDPGPSSTVVLLVDIDTAYAKLSPLSSSGYAQLSGPYSGYELAFVASSSASDYLYVVQAPGVELGFVGTTGGGGATGAPYVLASGYYVGPGAAIADPSGTVHLLYSTLGSLGFGAWVPPSSGYLGFSLTRSGSTYYGFVAVSVDGTSEMTVERFAIETTPGVGVTVPEPGSGSLAMLALGAGGLSAWRRRRAAS